MSVDRMPTGAEVFADSWATYLDLRDRRAGDLDRAESDAIALGFASREDHERDARQRALYDLYGLVIADDPDGFSFGTDAPWEADRSSLTDADIADTLDELRALDVAALVARLVQSFLAADHERGYHDPRRRGPDDSNDRPNLTCERCPGDYDGPTPVGFLPVDRFERWHAATVAGALVAFASLDRRARVRLAARPDGWTSGLAPAAHPINPTGLRDEQRELVTVWSSWVHQADVTRRSLALACDPCRAGRHADCTAVAGDCTNLCHPTDLYNVWRGSWVADVDTGDERYALSPSGRWAHELPPIYAAGMDAYRRAG